MLSLTVLRLAWADLWHDRKLATCTLAAFAAVLSPLLVLAGLREGVINGLREALIQDPNTRQVLSAANHEIPVTLLAALAGRSDVAFLVPRTRTLAASLLLEAADGRQVRAELIPSAPGDPLLLRPPGQPDEIVLSAAAAARLGLGQGQLVTGRLSRILASGQRQLALLPLRITAVAPPRAFAREAAFVTLPLAAFIEDYQDGRAEAPAGGQVLPASAAPERVAFAGFRLYARRLEDVPALDAALRAQGLDVVSRAGDVAWLLIFDRHLRLLLALVAGLGGVGYMISLGTGLWAGVERRRPSLALLRFLGLPAGALALLPVIQALTLGLAGTLIAVAVALGAAAALDHSFADGFGLGRDVCRIGWRTCAAGLALTLAGALAASLAAGWRIGRVNPWEALR